MASNRTDAPKEGEAHPAAPEASAASGGNAGGIKQWLPLLANIVLMPVVAYFMTTMLLVPKLKADKESPSSPHAPAKSEAKGAHGEGALGKDKFTAPLGNKVLV